MNLLEELQKERPEDKRKVPTSAYLTAQQRERLEALVKKSRKSMSTVLGRLVDLAFESGDGL